jgi:hypothetical protein
MVISKAWIRNQGVATRGGECSGLVPRRELVAAVPPASSYAIAGGLPEKAIARRRRTRICVSVIIVQKLGTNSFVLGIERRMGRP